MYYTIARTVNSYECDCNNVLKLSSAMQLMQQASGEQLESLGLPVEFLLNEGFAFVFSKIHMRIHRMPHNGEAIVIGTAPTPPHGARFIREFVIDSADGERLIESLSDWLLVDAHTHRLLRPAAFPFPLPYQEEALGALKNFPAFKNISATPEPAFTQTIAYSHLDINKHVNNAVYGDFVCNALPFTLLEGRPLTSLSLTFKQEAVHGDMLHVATAQPEENLFYIEGKHTRGDCFSAFVGF